MSEATAGDIVALTGLTNTASGDTIIEASDLEQVLLERIVTPQPVFTYSVEPETQKDKKRLLKALEDLSKEDSTIVMILSSILVRLILMIVFKHRNGPKTRKMGRH